jgi:Domain of unknown function (DUF1854)
MVAVTSGSAPDPAGTPLNAAFTVFVFSKNEWGQLVLTLPNGIMHTGVEPIRCFPLTDPDRAIAIVDSDGHELVNLPSLDVLNPDAADFIRRELTEREFMPTIQRIIATSTPNPPCRWDVETDRGSTSFQLESEDDLRKLGATGAVIADTNGIRYTIPNINQLDAASQRTIRRLL